MLGGPDGEGRVELMAEEFGPDIVIPPDARDVAIWTEISSTDDSGVTIQGIKKDDTIEIESIAGICSFSGQTTGRRVLSVVGIVGGILGATTGIAGTAGKLLKSQASSIKTEVGNASAKGDGGGKRRDGYGKDVGGKEFAANEGGIIVCMPSARGPIYASQDNHLADDAKKEGRLRAHVRKAIQNKCFFPCREEGGEMARKAQEDGTLHILVFDSDFSDNAGSYEMRFRVRRGDPR